SVYQAERIGFARVDLVAGPDGGRLVVSLLAVDDGLFARSRPARVTARWSVDRHGAARAEPLAAE
ncbi:MAG TPA: hypothetical protein VLC53_03570, partial [Myxococcota bacterium]|nr:hypothetical protein [Myxococcota bacterium]